jgi:homoserine kinase
MLAAMKSVQVRVPATTANLGPGFDSLGIALQIHNTTTVTLGKGDAPGPMALEAAEAFFAATGIKPRAFHWSVEGGVPRSRGLGSSVTVRLGILAGLNALAGKPLSRHRLFELCAGLEGHPDNAAPGVFGGFCIAPKHGAVQRHTVSQELAFAILIPAMELETKSARAVLPDSVPLGLAAVNAGQSAAIAAAFATRDYRKLKGCFVDHLHQPHRARLLPFLEPVIEAACRAGALGGWLSGAGSSIACVSLSDPARVARAMIAASGLDEACAIVVRADNSGLRIA